MFNPLSAGFFTDYGRYQRAERYTREHGTLLGVQEYKKVKFPGRDNSSLAVKGLRKMNVSARKKKLKPATLVLYILFWGPWKN